MAITNSERVSKMLELLRDGLKPFVSRELAAGLGGQWRSEVDSVLRDTRLGVTKGEPLNDSAVLLVLIDRQWGSVFRKTLGKAERSFVNELLAIRNKWAHQQTFSSDDTDRAIDSSMRLLNAVSAPEADELGRMKMELRRLIFDEQMRQERRRGAGTTIEVRTSEGLKPWREVVKPHPDVASGNYQQAEFAADLWQVHLGEGGPEYRDPAEFFRRTFLTESLKGLLTGAVKRISGLGGDPVVQLQTNFGGGKTHSMLALYHLFSGTAPGEMLGVEEVLQSADGASLQQGVHRVVLVGNKISPGNPITKEDGTVVRTLWGELAWQLGGAEAFGRIQADDERATNPGDRLRELMNDYGPCLILIDEWVAYARQLHDDELLPAGSFETHFSFAQALTESAKLAKNTMLVISLPSSDSIGSPQTRVEDVEVGGERGRAALERLRNAVGRVESPWRPANAEEGFEIVRRRLFEPIVEREQFVARDTVARAFFDLYRTQQQEFPSECRNSDYEKRIKAAYPIHPEVFERLYTDWSTLVKFQRTRGVLRLMATVIHSRWEQGERTPLIMPSSIPIDDSRVQFELTRYLSDNWVPIIESDVDGPNALPMRLDGEVPNLGQYSACRRVARTVYLGSAPISTAANRGLEDRRVKLGCVMPGEPVAVFGDAMRRLGTAATYLYQDGNRYWYSTQPTVTKLADDRAEELKRQPDRVLAELDKRLREDLHEKGVFRKVHVLPQTGADVSDELEARLVVLGPDFPHSNDPNSTAVRAAREILEKRGTTPRIHQNTLVFLAPDSVRYQELEEALRRFLAWQSIVSDREELQLTPNQVSQAETQKTSADSSVRGRMPECFNWLLVPEQQSPQDQVRIDNYRLRGQEALAVRAGNKLQTDDLLAVRFSGVALKLEIDRIPLWRGNHVPIRQLADDFSRYPYLQRLAGPDVLEGAVSDGLTLLLWHQDGFGFADRFDVEAERFVGLRGGEPVRVAWNSADGVLVKGEVTLKQLEKERPETPKRPDPDPESPEQPGPQPPEPPGPIPPQPQSKRFHGTVELDPQRPGRDAGRIAEEVISHLTGLVGSNVKVTLHIDAEIEGGVPEQVVRTVTENSGTLKFSQYGFEKD